MSLMCGRAVAIGLPAIVFTEHFDFDHNWRTELEDLLPHQQHLLDSSGYLRPPPFDIVGYLDCIDRCRHRFPDLTILTGVEFGQPHLHAEHAAQLVDLSGVDRVNGSLHTLRVGEDRYEPNTLFRKWRPDDVVNAYLAEIPQVVAGSDEFEVFCHIDYAVRAWPTTTAGPFNPHHFGKDSGQPCEQSPTADEPSKSTPADYGRGSPNGGKKKAATPSPSAATPTSPKHSPTTSPKLSR